MNPLMGFALAHPAQSPLHDLERISLQVGQEKQQPILGRGQRAVLAGGIPAGGAGPPIEAPLGHLGLEGGLKRGHQRPKLIHRATSQIEPLGRTGLDVDKPQTSQGCASFYRRHSLP